jgi:D-alanyl-lipoteichoic acid acyltransferase DltB (MBOAT superfamily)
MIFSSFQFIFLFLPIVLIGTALLQRLGSTPVKLWLSGVSLVFYAAWSWWPPYILVLAGSIAVNFILIRLALACPARSRLRLAVVIIGISANLCLLGWFKYAGFLTFNLNALFGTQFHLAQLVLPLGISFFTFQKIALLIDIQRGEIEHISPLDYVLFVTFFPQLIAGPIVLYQEVADQYAERGRLAVNPRNLLLGFSVFALGFFKKAAIADPLADLATPVFAAAAAGTAISTAEAWTGALAYTFQLYFDFSGYSDMAVGLAAMFGIVLPFNFVSPYKATSIIEFWRRWHVTLSRFLRVYLYIPLGGNRAGPRRRYVNLLVVMLLGGLWHGAAWTFVAWGALHGIFLVINHLWRTRNPTHSFTSRIPAPFRTAGSWTLTFLAVVVAWVFFRADTFAAAHQLLLTMVDPVGLYQMTVSGYPSSNLFSRTTYVASGILPSTGYVPIMLCAALIVCLIAPNSQTLFRNHLLAWLGKRIEVFPGTPGTIRWEPSTAWALACGAMLAFSIMAIARGSSPFLYFNF